MDKGVGHGTGMGEEDMAVARLASYPRGEGRNPSGHQEEDWEPNRHGPSSEYIKRFQISQVCLYTSCLCCAVKIKSSIFLISSTLLNHNVMDGGRLCFHKMGMHPFPALSKWRTSDFLYVLMGIEER